MCSPVENSDRLIATRFPVTRLSVLALDACQQVVATRRDCRMREKI
jgi:hypothetical protein